MLVKVFNSMSFCSQLKTKRICFTFPEYNLNMFIILSLFLLLCKKQLSQEFKCSSVRVHVGFFFHGCISVRVFWTLKAEYLDFAGIKPQFLCILIQSDATMICRRDKAFCNKSALQFCLLSRICVTVFSYLQNKSVLSCPMEMRHFHLK